MSRRTRQRRRDAALRRKKLIEIMQMKETQCVPALRDEPVPEVEPDPAPYTITSQPVKALSDAAASAGRSLLSAADAIINKRIADNECKDV